MQKLSLAVSGIFLLAGAVFAQSEIGGVTLNGTVTDPSGAGIPGAKVTATQTATGFARSTQTSSAGLYNLSPLPAGSYDLSVEAAGFKLAKLGGVSFSVGAVQTVDLKMEIGTPERKRNRNCRGSGR